MGTRILKKIKIHFSFFLLFSWFIITQNILSFIMFCAVVMTHEFGHYIMAKKLGYKLNNFLIAPYGVCLNYKEKSFEQKDEFLIALAGPAVNIVLSCIAVSFWWIFPSSYFITSEFVRQSMVLALFNLLPCYPLDGGRVFAGIMSNIMQRKNAIKLSIFFNIVITCVLFLFFIISCFINFNPSFCLCAIFMVLGIVEGKAECKYQPIVLYKKRVKNYSKPIFYTVSANTTLSEVMKHIEINRYTVFVVVFENEKTKLLDEQAVKRLLLVYSLDTTLEKIFMKDRE